MGYIKEPAGVDFFVDAAPLTNEERQRISKIIAYYKATGKKMLPAKALAKISTRATNTPKKKALS